jgi:6-pyruvoyltetrahydropterin/6-carboxytetrahydropterin synthase
MCVNTADSAYGELRARYGDRIVSFENEDPTTEVLARVIFQTFAKKLADYAAKNARDYPLGTNVRLVSVKVWETASCWAEYVA